MANVTLASNALISLTSLPTGDLNSDNTINSLDWGIMNTKWFTNDAIADLNKDTIVNTIDFSFMNRNWGRVGE